MAKTRDAVTYELRQGNEVVYVGMTNNPKRLEREHRREGKKFSHMKVTSRRMTEGGAKKKDYRDVLRFVLRAGTRGLKLAYHVSVVCRIIATLFNRFF